jgi:hypothetical protein
MWTSSKWPSASTAVNLALIEFPYETWARLMATVSPLKYDGRLTGVKLEP